MNKFPYKLGKKRAKKDSRNIRLKAVLRLVLPPIPEVYMVDASLAAAVPTPMFANDLWGDCVIAARAHQTLRFEAFEQNLVLPITDDEVLAEYWKEGKVFPCDRRPDRGLVLLDSLKKWRKDGWAAGGQHHDIYAFAEMSPADFMDVKASVFLLAGTTAGIMISQSALDQFEVGLPWDIVDNPGQLRGGHAIDVVGYDLDGPVCVTWGRLQHMTWRFWGQYCDEAYAVVDNRDRFLERSPVDVKQLETYLQEVTK